MRARAPNRDGVTTRSGSTASAPATRKLALPSLTISPGRKPRRDSTMGSNRMPNRPSRSASASCTAPGGSSTGVPTSGQARSTAFSSTSWRSPDAAITIERICTISDAALARPAMNAWTSGASGSLPPSTSRSPPRIRRPSASMPALTAARRLPTAAMTATPRARHSTTPRRPRTPPRSSRRARRSASIRMARPPAQRRLPYAPGGRSGRPGAGHG